MAGGQGDPGPAGDITTDLARLRARIAATGRDPAEVTVVAVTKGQPAAVARAAVEAGLADLGESYAQELVPKAEALLDDPPAGPPARWHFIGRLQRNKVRQVAPFVGLWQSIDRLSLAAEVARRAPGAEVLVQVNATGEEAKGGCRPELVGPVVEGCRDLGLVVRGLMAVGPTGPPEQARPAFRAVRELADRLDLDVRSMGMSGDLEVALDEGATMVRIGTALVGRRPGHHPK
ncbi:MAG: YggS family pyridoxal phosphate-dependent enzyme [Acidimicrobiia bacterium]